MRAVAKFEKVSYEQFKTDLLDCLGSEYPITEDDIKEIYNNIKLPKRATQGSAGYDFYSPIYFELKPGETIKLPTGIRCKMDSDVVLMLYPRSGLGFKYRMQLNNTVGVIDSDYYNAKNEGHIMAKITNDTNENKNIIVLPGDGFMQGVFTEFLVTVDDEASGIRTGGFGSTTKN